MLFEKYTDSKELGKHILPLETFKPYPTFSEREKWTSLDEPLKKHLIKQGEQYLGYSWPVVTATSIMAFVRTGDRVGNEEIHFTRRTALGNLVLAECVEAQGRFLDDIINGFWAICEESSWSVNSHMDGVMLPNVVDDVIIDLFSAETGSTLAMLLYVLESELNKVTPVIAQRVKAELKRRICIPYLEKSDYWWMSFNDGRVNNWNPWCNSNCLTTCMYILEDEKGRTDAFLKAMESLEKFYAVYGDDGGCDEGPRYWDRAAASLFDCLSLMYQVTNGFVDCYDQKRIKNMGSFIVKGRLTERHYINFADSSVKVKPDASLIYRFGKAIGDENMVAEASYIFHNDKTLHFYPWYSTIRVFPAVFGYHELSQMKKQPQAVKKTWFSDIEVLVARQKDMHNAGLVLAAKGGHNNESHNHNDVGSFVVYKDGEPVLIDVGVGVYTKKTFSPERYDIWTMRSDYHNVPIINGVVQKDGREYQVTKVKCEEEKLSMYIEEAYPDCANVKSWQRTFFTGKAEEIKIVDAYSLTEYTAGVSFVFMTAYPPVKEGENIIIGNATLSYDAQRLSFSAEEIVIDDRILKENWEEKVYRILLKVIEPTETGEFAFVIR